MLRRIFLGLILAWFLTANKKQSDELSLFVAMIYQFPSYIEWNHPKLKNKSTFNILVLGSKEIQKSISIASKRGIKSLPVSILDNKENGSAHMVVIGSDYKLTVEDRKYLEVCSCAVIVQAPNKAVGSGTILVYRLEEFLRFDINLKQASKQHLYVSSRLLKLAQKVTQP